MDVVAAHVQDLPCPPATIQFDLPVAEPTLADLAPLPAKPGVLAIENETGQTVFLATTANLRKLAVGKLGLNDPESPSSPRMRIDPQLARSVIATRVGSRFEADWAYLQFARQRLPLTYRTLLDRWQAWFVRCDPADQFPQWTKTPHPALEEGSAEVVAGPFPDKHAAWRYIELLQAAFDLCRYHHILIQAPHGSACAYKEMGKCPAPCDGTVSLDAYLAQIKQSIAFVNTPITVFQDEVRQNMTAASAEHDFEQAQRCRNLLDAVKPATRREFSMVRSLKSLSIVFVQPSEKTGWVRLFLIRGGWIAPLADVRVDQGMKELGEVVETVRAIATPKPTDFDVSALENFGMVCWHLFQPLTSKARGEFIRIDELDAKSLRSAVRRVARIADTEDAEGVADQSLESVDSD